MTLFIDHVVITVNDINLSIDFYTNILGMEQHLEINRKYNL
jgi:catechol 2,3-dioxygenase-like lactoylglutathione lyase family enzyme